MFWCDVDFEPFVFINKQEKKQNTRFQTYLTNIICAALPQHVMVK